jgi:flagellar biosynthesis chaperone FliJ
MTESTPTADNAPATAADLAEIIAEMEAYRERLVQDVTEAAQKAKLTKAQMMVAMGADLDLIDSKIQQLRDQHAQLTGSN